MWLKRKKSEKTKRFTLVDWLDTVQLLIKNMQLFDIPTSILPYLRIEEGNLSEEEGSTLYLKICLVTDYDSVFAYGVLYYSEEMTCASMLEDIQDIISRLVDISGIPEGRKPTKANIEYAETEDDGIEESLKRNYENIKNKFDIN